MTPITQAQASELHAAILAIPPRGPRGMIHTNDYLVGHNDALVAAAELVAGVEQGAAPVAPSTDAGANSDALDAKRYRFIRSELNIEPSRDSKGKRGMMGWWVTWLGVGKSGLKTLSLEQVDAILDDLIEQEAADAAMAAPKGGA